MIQVNNNKNISLFSQNLIIIFLKSSQIIEKLKIDDLIFEMTIPYLKSRLLSILLMEFHILINIYKSSNLKKHRWINSTRIKKSTAIAGASGSQSNNNFLKLT